MEIIECKKKKHKIILMNGINTKKEKCLSFNIKDRSEAKKFYRFSVNYTLLISEFSKAFNIVVIPKELFMELVTAVKNGNFKEADKIIKRVQITTKFYCGRK